jgi:hypothetical protein
MLETSTVLLAFVRLLQPVKQDQSVILQMEKYHAVTQSPHHVVTAQHLLGVLGA